MQRGHAGLHAHSACCVRMDNGFTQHPPRCRHPGVHSSLMVIATPWLGKRAQGPRTHAHTSIRGFNGHTLENAHRRTHRLCMQHETSSRNQGRKHTPCNIGPDSKKPHPTRGATSNHEPGVMNQNKSCFSTQKQASTHHQSHHAMASPDASPLSTQACRQGMQGMLGRAMACAR